MALEPVVEPRVAVVDLPRGVAARSAARFGVDGQGLGWTIGRKNGVKRGTVLDENWWLKGVEQILLKFFFVISFFLKWCFVSVWKAF